jgi:hypothetical protein
MGLNMVFYILVYSDIKLTHYQNNPIFDIKSFYSMSNMSTSMSMPLPVFCALSKSLSMFISMFMLPGHENEHRRGHEHGQGHGCGH